MICCQEKNRGTWYSSWLTNSATSLDDASSIPDEGINSKQQPCGFSPQEYYTDRATAACRQS
jgi:hypothetical protein